MVRAICIVFALGPWVDLVSDLAEASPYNDFNGNLPRKHGVVTPHGRHLFLRAFQCACESKLMQDKNLAMLMAWASEQFAREAETWL